MHILTANAPLALETATKRKDGVVEFVFSSVKYKTQLATHTQQTFVETVFFTGTRTLRFSNTQREQSLISAACRQRGGGLSEPDGQIVEPGTAFHKAIN